MPILAVLLIYIATVFSIDYLGGVEQLLFQVAFWVGIATTAYFFIGSALLKPDSKKGKEQIRKIEKINNWLNKNAEKAFLRILVSAAIIATIISGFTSFYR